MISKINDMGSSPIGVANYTLDEFQGLETNHKISLLRAEFKHYHTFYFHRSTVWTHVAELLLDRSVLVGDGYNIRWALPAILHNDDIFIHVRPIWGERDKVTLHHCAVVYTNNPQHLVYLRLQWPGVTAAELDAK